LQAGWGQKRRAGKVCSITDDLMLACWRLRWSVSSPSVTVVNAHNSQSNWTSDEGGGGEVVGLVVRLGDGENGVGSWEAGDAGVCGLDCSGLVPVRGAGGRGAVWWWWALTCWDHPPGNERYLE
jgi:hypothetical protein